MTTGNYDRILEKIAKASGLDKSEIENMVEARRSKLSGLISREGAAQVIAAELGVSFENEKLKIDELLPGMRSVNVVGKVITLFPVRSFKTKRGDESKVANMWIADDSSNIKVVLWDTHHVQLIEAGEIKEGTVVDIKNAAMRESELHLGNFSEIKPSSESFENVVTERVLREKNISDFKKGENVSTRAFIVQAFEPRFFNVCPECGKKVTSEGDTFVCLQHEKVMPEKRAVSSIVLDDGTESIRAVLFHEVLNKLGITEFNDPDALLRQKEAILGKEMIFSGNVRNNAFFNTPEFIVNDIKDINLDELIISLENKA
ncbi:DUF2240 family protein [Candidatus Pacearchaeota archaeon]|nr:DUF2240 family protein [Candidatus Pacearchaeota archaeon]